MHLLRVAATFTARGNARSGHLLNGVAEMIGEQVVQTFEDDVTVRDAITRPKAM